MKFSEDSLRGFQVTEQTRFVTDRQTNARGKTICLPTLNEGDIIHTIQYSLTLFNLTVELKLCSDFTFLDKF